MTQTHGERLHDDSSFVIPSSLDIRHSSSPAELIANAAKLASLIQEIGSAERVAIDTEAVSLHSDREQICLIQISVPAGVIELGNSDEIRDYIVDPLALVD